ncbi:hypothetical protein IGI67_002423 [Enterococcus sp. AZ196]
MRFEIARLVDTNFREQTKFLTLTFEKNIEDIDYANYEFNKFIKRLNYDLYKTKKAQLKYIATWELQKRGAIHYHLILFDFPYIPFKRLESIWGHGYIKINKIDVDSIENRGRYISKYFDKDLEMKNNKKKAFFKSRNLSSPQIIKTLSDSPYTIKNKEVLYSSDYIVRRPNFHNRATNEQKISFHAVSVHYTKIKK